jgi:NAD(P)H-quinone oxidoreductase subunit 5
MGAYLLLRIEPILRAAPAVQAFTVVTGLVTAVYATMAGRAATDAKTSLAYASMGQVGIIFAEIAMGWTWIALIHTVSHAAVRTLQFLRAPSMLHDHHRVHAAAGGQLPKTGTHYETLLPASARSWLYRFALDRGHVDTMLDRFLIGPALRAACSLAAFEAGKPVTEYRRALHASASEAYGGKTARSTNA